MRFTSTNNEDFITLTKIEVENHRFPSVRTNIDLRDGGFSATGTAWFEKDSLDDFRSQLNDFAKTRAGHARLESMSPGDCVLVITPSNTLGHCVIEYQLMSIDGATKLTGVLELVHDSFEAMITELDDLRNLNVT